MKIYPEDLDYSKLVNLDEYHTIIPDNLYITEDIDNTGIIPDTTYILNDRDDVWCHGETPLKHIYGRANREFDDNFEKYKKAFLKAKEDRIKRVLNAGKPPVLHPITNLVMPK